VEDPIEGRQLEIISSMVDFAEGEKVVAEEEIDPNACLFCLTVIDWLYEAWPEEHLAERPEFLPRERKPLVRIHREQADPMPFCEACSHMFMAMLSQFHKERQEREGKEATPLKARVEQKIVTPAKQIVLPGQPGFNARS
jgi:hypothetical protein